MSIAAACRVEGAQLKLGYLDTRESQSIHSSQSYAQPRCCLSVWLGSSPNASSSITVLFQMGGRRVPCPPVVVVLATSSRIHHSKS